MPRWRGEFGRRRRLAFLRADARVDTADSYLVRELEEDPTNHQPTDAVFSPVYGSKWSRAHTVFSCVPHAVGKPCTKAERETNDKSGSFVHSKHGCSIWQLACLVDL